MLIGQHVIELAKITDYLLNPNHPTGRHKAVYFTSFGFVQSDPAAFAAALEHHARYRLVKRAVESDHGVKREVRCNLITPDGRNPCIVAIWLQPARLSVHRFVTAYPYRGPTDEAARA